MRIAREVRDLLQPADPARHLGPPPAARTPVVLPRVRSRRRVLVAVAGLTVAATAAVTVASALRGHDRAYAVTPTPLPMTQDGPAAADALRALAEVARAGPADPQDGPVLFLWRRSWGLDSTLDGAEPWSAVMPFEQRVWRRADGSGRSTTTWLPPEQTYPDPLPPHYRKELRTGTDKATWEPGELPGGGPVATDQTGIRAQIYASNPEGNGPKSAVRGVSDLYQYRRVERDARVAALLFLAGIPQLRTGGPTLDRSGRPGIAVYLEQGGVRDTLVLDGVTGAVLAYEMTLLVNPGALDNLRYPAVISYATYLEARQIDQVPD